MSETTESSNVTSAAIPTDQQIKSNTEQNEKLAALSKALESQATKQANNQAETPDKSSDTLAAEAAADSAEIAGAGQDVTEVPEKKKRKKKKNKKKKKNAGAIAIDTGEKMSVAAATFVPTEFPTIPAHL